MSDIKPCFNCGELYHIDDMKCCQYDFDSYCQNCDSDLVMIESIDGFRTYVHKNSITHLRKEQPLQHWKLV
jgi:hypothetical protein